MIKSIKSGVVMNNQKKINEIDTKIKELEDKVENCPSLVDELEILLSLQKLYENRDNLNTAYPVVI